MSAAHNQEGEWIAHDGWICPIPTDTLIDYRLRSGWESDGPVLAGYCRWDKGRTPESAANEADRKSDIIAYRVVRP